MSMTAAVGATVIGTGFSMYSKITAGNQQKKMFDQNAKFANMQAKDAVARGAFAEKFRRRGTERVIGAQRVGFAAQHVDVNKGSAIDVQANAAYLGELDALTIRNNAAKEAYGYQVDAYNSSMAGVNARERGQMDAIGTFLGSASSLALAGASKTGSQRQPTGSGSSGYSGYSDASANYSSTNWPSTTG